MKRSVLVVTKPSKARRENFAILKYMFLIHDHSSRLLEFPSAFKKRSFCSSYAERSEARKFCNFKSIFIILTTFSNKSVETAGISDEMICSRDDLSFVS